MDGNTPKARKVFPTPVGVNRRRHDRHKHDYRIPHARGGEPMLPNHIAKPIKYSPRPWG